MGNIRLLILALRGKCRDPRFQAGQKFRALNSKRARNKEERIQTGQMITRFQKRYERAGAIYLIRQRFLGETGLPPDFLQYLRERFGQMRYFLHRAKIPAP